MLSKEEYIELYVKGGQAINAILEVLNNLAEVKVEIAGEEAIKIIRDFQQKYFDLINEHFKPKENTEEYKHFKLHSDSTLKNQTKKELIDYIKMLYHNWGVTDEQLKRVIDKAKELSDSNNELERTVCSLDYALSDVYNPKPYKFEELKPNMWVWDNVAKECLYVVRPFITTGVRVKYFTCLGIWNLEKIKKLNMKFEENRFFPVQCANYLGGI
ncbi:hypothetical protein [Thomasclavelia ramosa]|uniref:hypothetical protein n=1 Tax=Thomasclavelia ramosa TaxID=1547 RepID=UPI001F1CEB90|nr:hypothetical protein [Thomasclavelia ramosa]